MLANVSPSFLALFLPGRVTVCLPFGILKSHNMEQEVLSSRRPVLHQPPECTRIFMDQPRLDQIHKEKAGRLLDCVLQVPRGSCSLFNSERSLSQSGLPACVFWSMQKTRVSASQEKRQIDGESLKGDLVIRNPGPSHFQHPLRLPLTQKENRALHFPVHSHHGSSGLTEYTIFLFQSKKRGRDYEKGFSLVTKLCHIFPEFDLLSSIQYLG